MAGAAVAVEQTLARSGLLRVGLVKVAVMPDVCRVARIALVRAIGAGTGPGQLQGQQQREQEPESVQSGHRRGV